MQLLTTTVLVSHKQAPKDVTEKLTSSVVCAAFDTPLQDAFGRNSYGGDTQSGIQVSVLFFGQVYRTMRNSSDKPGIRGFK